MFSLKKIVIISVIIVFLVAVITLIKPKYEEYDLTHKAVLFRINEDHQDFEQPITIHIQGKMKTDAFGRKTFKGRIDIEGDEYFQVPEKNRVVELNFKNRGAFLSYFYYEKSKPMFNNYGYVHINKDLNKFVITGVVPSKTGEDYSGPSYMIAAPATSRSEGIEMTKEILGWNL